MFKASDVKELREKTGAGMLDCKKALTETEGDMEKAIDWLREKGISKAAKKEGRVAAEGLCEIKIEGNNAVMIEVNSETDFVAQNEEFTSFVTYLSEIILKNNFKTNEEVLNFQDGEETIQDKLVAKIAKIGEKIDFRRFQKLEKKEDEVFGSYKHMGGKIGALVILNGAKEEVAKDVAMHVAAMNPIAINRNEVPQDLVERESHIIKEQVMQEGKPEDIAEKMVVGRLNKFYKEACLEEQPFIKENSINVKTYVENNGGKLISMVRFAVGEGIEKKEEDFAAEVMNQVNGQ
ncbi:MAG: elongation factor Ts [Bacilli bacterium]|nr:elongation factor Ts [Bacilli bacterium]